MIGITGVATSGKDTLFNFLYKKYKENNIVCQRFALADLLKKDLYVFIKMLFNIDLYLITPEQKELIRPILVVYGKYKRNASGGRYWIEKLNGEILNYLNRTKNLLPIVTDIRYSEYLKDEVFWLKNEMNGVLIHVSRRKNGNLIPPANEEEARNDKKLFELSDYRLIWDTDPDKDALYKNVSSDIENIIKLYESKRPQ